MTRYRFAGCTLEPASRVLSRAGQPVAVQAQVFDLIHFLLRHPNTVFSKSALLAEVWGNSHLTDAAITQAVRKARQALGDDGVRQLVIRTVHGQGFSCVAEVQVERQRAADAAPPSNPSSLPTATPLFSERVRWTGLSVLAVCALGLLVLSSGWLSPRQRSTTDGGPMLSVFPFSNQTGDADLDWLQHGLANTVGMLIEQSGARVSRVMKPGDDFPHDPGDDLYLDDDSLASSTAMLGADFGLTAIIKADAGRFAVEWTIARSDGDSTQGTFSSASATTLARQIAEQAMAAIGSQPRMPTANLPMLKDPLALELYARGTEALYQDDRDQAIALLTAARSRAPQMPMLEVAVAVAQFDASDVAASLARYRDSLAALPEDAAQARAQLEYEIGTRSWFAGAIGEAESLLQGVVDRTSADEALHASALNSLSLVLQSQSQYDAAWERARQAEVLFRQRNNPYHLSMVLTNLGYMAEDLGRLSESAELHQQALDIRRRYHFPSLIAASQYGLARIERRRGRFDLANDLLAQSLATARQLNLPFDVFDNLEELAELRMHEGRFDEAREALREARALAVASDDPLGVAWADQVLARLHMRTGEVDAATVGLMQSAIEAFEEMGDLENLSLARLELAGVHVRMGDLTEAARELESLRVAQGFPNPVLDVHWQRLSAELKLLTHERSDAIVQLTDAMRIARHTGTLDLEAELALRLGQLALEDGDTAGARRLLAIAEAWCGDYYRTLELTVALQAAAGESPPTP